MLLHSSLFLAFIAYASALANSKPMFGSDNVRNPRFAGAASQSSLPYVVSIMAGATADASEWICQGVVIAKNVTITAASCLYDVENDLFIEKENIFIQTGSKKNILNPLPRGVKEVVIHPNFRYHPNSKMFSVDLAMLIPNSEFDANSVVVLATKKENTTKDITVEGFMASWGVTVDVDGNIVDGEENLKGIKTYFSKQSDCFTFYDQLPKPYELRPSSLCLSFIHIMKQGVCEGDAGAGLFVEDKKAKPPHPVLTAIASADRSGECPPIYPNVLTRIAPFLGWISTRTGQKVK